jgi:PadR family transcriptional regulator, regulatory protein PadR
MKKKNTSTPTGQGKAERYMKPCLLLALEEGQEPYGYELLKSIQEYGFLQGNAAPGMIYRHLRQLEENGFVISNWQTDEAGPARRTYKITPEGQEALAGWVEFMSQQARNLLSFIERYNKLTSKHNHQPV